MGKKVSVKAGKRSKKKAGKQQEAVKDPPSYEEDASMDFGGIPARDLKKNLGCG